MAHLVHTTLAEPAEFIRHLARQNQILACLRWLGEFQVLACIPLHGSTPANEVADVAGVPEMQLCRVVRMTATAGFLHEPRSGHIAHTALSTLFVTNLSFLDATMFLAETAAPTALQMATATHCHGDPGSLIDSAYSVAFNTSQSFYSACIERSRLQRQWSAYRLYAEDMDDSLIELLGRLNWRSLGNACIVDMCAPSTDLAVALVGMCPALHFIVQMIDPAHNNSPAVGTGKADDSCSGRVTVQRRVPATLQTVNDAAVYILRPTITSPSLRAQIQAELSAHLSVLRANASATLILAPPLLPEAGTVDPDVEALARSRDLSHLQLTNECELELGELIDMVNGVFDSRGGLVVVNKLRSCNGATVAVGIKYEPSQTALTQVS